MEYFLFDTALNGYHSLHVLRESYPESAPLFPASEIVSEYVAPFIFQKNEVNDDQLKALQLLELKEIVFVETDWALQELKQHLEQFVVQTINGREYYFRFWSQKILPNYLTSCNNEQLILFFGKIHRFICLGKEGEGYFQFMWDQNKLIEQPLETWNLWSPNSFHKNNDLPEKTFQSGEGQHHSQDNSVSKPKRRFFY